MLCDKLNAKISVLEGELVEAQTELAALVNDRNTVQRIERSLAALEGERKVASIRDELTEEFKEYQDKYKDKPKKKKVSKKKEETEKEETEKEETEKEETTQT